MSHSCAQCRHSMNELGGLTQLLEFLFCRLYLAVVFFFTGYIAILLRFSDPGVRSIPTRLQWQKTLRGSLHVAICGHCAHFSKKSDFGQKPSPSVPPLRPYARKYLWNAILCFYNGGKSAKTGFDPPVATGVSACVSPPRFSSMVRNRPSSTQLWQGTNPELFYGGMDIVFRWICPCD